MFRYAMQILTSLHDAVELESLMRESSQGKLCRQAWLTVAWCTRTNCQCGCTRQFVVDRAGYSQVDGNGQIVSRKPGPQDKLQ